MIAEELEEDVSRVEQICEKAKSFAPEYDWKKVYEQMKPVNSGSYRYKAEIRKEIIVSEIRVNGSRVGGLFFVERDSAFLNRTDPSRKSRKNTDGMHSWAAV
ncbi:MAG: hypothetical protein V8S31_03955 [Lachnospiraceae bacterium]